jgi:hypothetical protein
MIGIQAVEVDHIAKNMNPFLNFWVYTWNICCFLYINMTTSVSRRNALGMW